MSYVSAKLLEGATVTFKENYGPGMGSPPVGWPFPEEPGSEQAVVVAVAIAVRAHGIDVVLVLRSDKGDLGLFFAEGARVVPCQEVGGSCG